MMRFVFFVVCYTVSGIIPFVMLPRAEGSHSYLHSYPFFVLPVMGMVYFSRPFSALMVLCLATVTGFCGMLFSYGVFRPAPLIFVAQIFWLWATFWLVQRLVEIKSTEIHGMQEELERLDLAGAEYLLKKNELEKQCQGIIQRITRYTLLQSFTDRMAVTLQVSGIKSQVETWVKKLLGGDQYSSAELSLFAGEGIREEDDPVHHWLKSHRLPLLVEDYADDSRFTSPSKKPRSSIIACPIYKEGMVIGALKVTAPGSKVWDENDLRYVSDISNIISLSVSNALYYEKVMTLAVFDSLTGLYVRYRFDERIEEEFSRAAAAKSACSLIMFDIDYFKKVNDNYGHQVGDKVLKAVAQVIRAQTRDTDFCARYGGEEIAVIMPLTTLENAYRFADRIRERVSSLPFDEDGLSVTISGGVAEIATEVKDAASLIALCDHALYRAKEKGRNQIVKAHA